MDVDRLIALIQGQPALWDRSSPDYKDHILKQKSWSTIAEAFFEDWPKKSRETKTLLEAEIRGKWRHVRDNYTRFLQQRRKEGTSRRFKRKYIHADAMDFLRSAIEEKSLSSSTFDDDENSCIDAVPKMEVYDNGVYNESSHVDQGLCSPQSPPPSLQCSAANATNTTFKRRRTRASTAIFPTSEADDALDESNPPPLPEHDDPHRCYLISLLPYYRKLSEEDQLEFQHMVTKFFMKKRR